MRACWSLFVALLIACSGSDDDDDDGNGNSAGGSSGSSSSVGSVDCSDDQLNQTLSCNAPEVCCAISNAPNECATSCNTTLVLRCDDDGDCSAGGSCCWNRNGTTGSECQSGCESGFAPLCARSTDCPSALPCCLGTVYNGVLVRFCVEQQDFACL